MAYTRNSMPSLTEMSKLLEKEFAKHPGNWKNVVSDPSPRIEWNYEKDCAIVRKRDGTSVEIPRYKLMEPGKITPIDNPVGVALAEQTRMMQQARADYARHFVDRELALERDRQMQNEVNALEQARRMANQSPTELERKLANVASIRYKHQERYTTTGLGSPNQKQILPIPLRLPRIPECLEAARTPRRTFWAVLRDWFGRITRLNRDTAASDAASGSQAAIRGKGLRVQRDSLGSRYKGYF